MFITLAPGKFFIALTPDWSVADAAGVVSDANRPGSVVFHLNRGRDGLKKYLME